MVFNGIPVKRNVGGVETVGLYDTVSGQFFGNSGTGSFTAGDPVNIKAPDSCVYGTKFTMPVALVDSGYTFTGWKVNSTNITKDADTVEVSCDYDTLGVYDGSATITAQWTPNTYTVTLGKNGGTGGTDAIKEEYGVRWTNADAEPATILAVPELPNKTGNVFTGYWENGTLRIPANGSLVDSATLTTTTFTANTTLTAGWTNCKPDGYLDTIGAADKHISDVSVNVSNNQCVYTVTCAEGYEASGTVTTNTTAVADDFVDICSDGVVSTYTVTFNAEDATGSKDDVVCDVETDCDITNKTNEITKSDYEFLGWTDIQGSKTPKYKVTATSEGKIYINKDDTDDVELFAVWNPVCLSNKYLRIGTDVTDKICLYENRHDTSHPALAIRLATDSGLKTYYIDMSDAESNKTINGQSLKKLHIMYNNKQYNVYDLTALE